MHAPTSSSPDTQAPFFLDREAAAQALALVMPAIEASLDNPAVGESGVLCIVVMNPALRPWEAAFEDAILLEHAAGRDRETWDADYAAYARAKARTAWRSGLDTHALATQAPHLLRAGDAGVWGSAIVDGIVVATSGANPWYDEAFSGAIAYALRAVAKSRALAHPSALKLE
ncbi:hypothetical protein [Bordetella bronchialis]|uniref:Uncharacterized protein n=1 Tax=Bordetella bronchialis TaxID=463025 RepID=A0A193FJ64_9BORD|nr:hypothetical protein [Bordetella bronchialis]ANN67221.1 hypothetical protein BAU06_13780 [Bordetella bronchialis]ANN72300.1 hypothetical protein BAU08_13960 [Bordetella bronchialis]